jgi:predicted HAD superfamily Cof-like phosphohydrolase
MKSNCEKVLEFHETYNCAIGETPALQLVRLRKKLNREEHKELNKAIVSKDLPAIAKELCDLLYVVYGMGITFGIPVDECFAEVHRSNMSKLGPDGKPIYRADGKVLKGPDYFEPDLRKVLGLNTSTPVK